MSIPRMSVKKPGIRRKKPPIGVNRFLRILSGVGSNTVSREPSVSRVFNPWFLSKKSPKAPVIIIKSTELKAPMLWPTLINV